MPKKKAIFWSKFSKKCLKSGFWPFSKICLQRRKLGQIKVVIVICKTSENQFGRPKKKVDETFKIF